MQIDIVSKECELGGIVWQFWSPTLRHSAGCYLFIIKTWLVWWSSQTSDWGEVRSSNRSSPHFFCEVWGEDPQFFLCEEWGEVPQFHCEIEEKRYSSLFLNSNAQMPQKGSFFFPFRQISGMYLWLRSQIHIANINFKDIGSPRHGYRGSR